MSNFINNLIKGKNHDDKVQFQAQAVKILREMYPEFEVKEADKPELIHFGETQCSLQNVHAKYIASSKTTYDLKEILREHFSNIVGVLKQIETFAEQTFDDVKAKIYPQLMPKEFTEKAPMVSFEFGGGVSIGIVIDDDKTYRYATQPDLERWEITDFELYEVALENLEIKSAQLPMMAMGEDALIIQTHDSFDAARILLPKIRLFLGKQLGKPFNFGIPNRDFLICWSDRMDKEFQQTITQQIKKDFHEQAYPLGEKPFRLDADGQVKN